MEEILRLKGLDAVPPVPLPPVSVVPGVALTPRQIRTARADVCWRRVVWWKRSGSPLSRMKMRCGLVVRRIVCAC